MLPQISETDRCDCGAEHTAEHLFCHCPRLQAARSVLREKTGHTNFERLVKDDTRKAADWAIAFFGIASYGWPRVHEPNIFKEDLIYLSYRALEEAGYNR